MCGIKYQDQGSGFSFTDNGREEKEYGRFWAGKVLDASSILGRLTWKGGAFEVGVVLSGIFS